MNSLFCERIQKINNHISLIQDEYIEKFCQALINDILDLMFSKKLISGAEREDCLAVAKVYCDKRMMEMTLSSKYFFVADSAEEYKKKSREYMVAAAALEKEAQTALESFGSLGYNFEHLKYAVLNTKYEADLYCKRNHWISEFDAQALIEESKVLERSAVNVLNCLWSLTGQIYDDLVEDKNTAYQYYLKCCKREDRHNAYVFMLKGRYWQDFVGDYHQAIKYYLKSITIFKEYYRSWYKMGYCYYYLGEMNGMLVALDAVSRILQKRLNANSIRPMEMEQMFLACIQCAEILYRHDNRINQAISFELLAEMVWIKVADSEFFSLMCRNGEEEKNKYVEKVRKRLDIKRVYRSLTELYRRGNLPDKAVEYERKYAEAE